MRARLVALYTVPTKKNDSHKLGEAVSDVCSRCSFVLYPVS